MGRTLLENMEKAGKKIVFADRMPKGSATEAFYDPFTEKVVVKESEKDEAILVHEGVHAGQDVRGSAAFMKEGKIVKALQAGLANEAGATAFEVLRRFNDIRKGDKAALDSLRALTPRHPSYDLFAELVAWTEKDPSILEKTGDAEKLPDPAVVDGLIARFFKSKNLGVYIGYYLSKLKPETVEQALKDGEQGFKPAQFSSQDVLRMTLGENLYRGKRFPLTDKAVNEAGMAILRVLQDGRQGTPPLPQAKGTPFERLNSSPRLGFR